VLRASAFQGHSGEHEPAGQGGGNQEQEKQPG
jgi:hypothetical protein